MLVSHFSRKQGGPAASRHSALNHGRPSRIPLILVFIILLFSWFSAEEPASEKSLAGSNRLDLVRLFHPSLLSIFAEGRISIDANRTNFTRTSHSLSGTPFIVTPTKQIVTRTVSEELTANTTSLTKSNTLSTSLSVSASVSMTLTTTESRTSSLSTSVTQTVSATQTVSGSKTTSANQSTSLTSTVSTSQTQSLSFTSSTSTSLTQSMTLTTSQTESMSATNSLTHSLSRTANSSDTPSSSHSSTVTMSETKSHTETSSISPTSTSSPTLTQTQSLTPVIKTATFVLPPTITSELTETKTKPDTKSASASLSISNTLTLTTSLTSSASNSNTLSPSLTLSATLSLSETNTTIPTPTHTLDESITISITESLPLTTSVPPPTTTVPLTPTKTMLTACPDCGNGACTASQPFLCVCWKDTLRGFWLGGREEGEGCWDCLPAYWGPTCLNTCPGGRCSPCSLHGTCSNGVNGNGTCSCYSDPIGGYWTGASCQTCQPGYYGSDCRGKCNCYNDGTISSIRCFEGLTGNGTCACPAGRDPPDCRYCTAGHGGPNCTKCPGSPTPCSGNGVCDKSFGNCTCDTGWAGVSCDVQCVDCVDNPCKNGGQVRSGLCVCPDGFKGPVCQHKCPVDTWGAICHGRGVCTWEAGDANATCVCDYDNVKGWWSGKDCSVCASPHLSFMNNCSADCPFDTSSCPEGYQGPNCTVRCGMAPASLPPTFVNCSGRGRCSCYGECFCDEGFGGSYCQIGCPRSNGGLVCGGPTRGQCFDVTGNGTCRCFGNYVGNACESVCDCADPSFGSCTHRTNSSRCVCKPQRAGMGCELCSSGWRGTNCSTPCVNGVTVGTACQCNASYGSIGCAVRCESSPLGLCSGALQGLCQEGETGTGTCACQLGFYGPSCNCSISLCQAERPQGSVTCDTSTGQCICSPGFGGSACKDCLSESFWGAACNELCSCQHGTCARDSGECACYRDSVNGYWTGELCDECVAGYLTPECKLVSSLTPQLTSFQTGAATSGRSYTAQKLFYDSQEDSILVSGQMFARFDGSIDGSPRNVTRTTAFMMTNCANILGSFTAMNNTRMHAVVNCFPMSSGQQRIDFVSSSTKYPAPFSPLEVDANSTVTESVSRPPVPVPRFTITLTATEILVESAFLAYYRNGKTTQFGQVNGEAEWKMLAKTNYSTNREIQCLLFKSQVTDGGSERLMKLICVPIDPPLSLDTTKVPPVPSLSRQELFVAPLQRTDTADGYSGDSQGVVLYYSDELDGILIGAVTDTGSCTIHFLPAAFNTSVFNRLYRNRDCRQISGLWVKDGYVLVGIRKCEGAGCASTRPTVIRFRPVTWTSLVDNPPITSLIVEPLLPTDYIVAFSFDVMTSALVLVCRSLGNSFKILRILSTPNEFLVIGSQSSSSPDSRGVADVHVIPEKRVLLLLHKATTGVAIRRYALTEALSITPEISDRRGGTVITVAGRGFASGLGRVQCKIGGFVFNGTVIDSTHMVCVSPVATGTSCSVDTVDVSIYNSIFTVNRLPLRRIDYPKLRTATPDLQRFYAPQMLMIETTRADESVYTRCKYAAISRSNNNTVIFNASIVVNGSAYFADGRTLIRCDPPPLLVGSTVASLDVALDGTVFSGVDVSELPTIRYLGDPVAITPSPQNIRLSSAATIKLPQFVASVVDISGTAFGSQFNEIVKYFVTPVLPPPLANASTIPVGQVEGVPAARLATFIHTTPVISSGDRKGRGVFSGDLATDQKIIVVNPPQGVVHLIVNLTSVFDAAFYPWATTFIVTVFPGSIQRILITRQPGDTITVDGLVNDVEVQIQDAAGNVITGANNVTIGAAVVETFLGGDPSLIPKFITDGNPTRVNSAYEALVANSGTATFKSLRLATRGMYAYSLRFYIAFVNASTALPDYKTSNKVDPVNTTASAESQLMLPSCNIGDVRTIGSYTCEPCLEHADCGDGSSVVILPGYWRSSAYSSAAFPCTPRDACLGGPVTGQCAKGYEGPVCSICSSGYGKSAVKGECEECPPLGIKVLFFAILCLGFIFVLALTVVLTAQSWRRQTVTITLMQLFVDHMHTIMMIGALDLPYPSFFLSAITWSGLFTLQLLDLSVSDCVVREGGNYFTKFFVYAVMCAMCFLVAAVAWIVLFIFPNIFRDSSSRRRHLRRVRNWAREVEDAANRSGAAKGHRNALSALAAGGPTNSHTGAGEGMSEAEWMRQSRARRIGHSARRKLINLFNPSIIDEEMAIALEGLTDDESDAEMQVIEERRAGGGKDGSNLASLMMNGNQINKSQTPPTVSPPQPMTRASRRRKDPSVILKNHSFRLLSGHSLQVIMFFVLPSIVFYSLSMFNCTDIPDPLLGDRSYMNADMRIDCDGSNYNSMYNIGITVATLYLVCAPFGYLLLYWRDLRYFYFHIKKRQQTFAFSMMGIKSSQWFWPAVLLLRKGLQAMIVVLLPNPIDAQVFMWLLAIFIVLHVHTWPYLSHRMNYLQMVCALSELFSLCTCYFLDMVNTEQIAMDFIAVIALLIMLSVALLVLVFALHHTLEMIWLNFRVHVLGDNLTETQSTDSFHLEGLQQYRVGANLEHIPLPLGAEDHREAIVGFTGELMTMGTKKDKEESPARDASDDEEMQTKAPDDLGGSVIDGGGAAGSGGNLSSPLLDLGATASFSPSSSAGGLGVYSPPSFVVPSASSTSFATAQIRSSGIGGGGGAYFSSPKAKAINNSSSTPSSGKEGPSPLLTKGGKGTRQSFGVDVDALQRDDHFNKNYPSRDTNINLKSETTSASVSSSDRFASQLVQGQGPRSVQQSARKGSGPADDTISIATTARSSQTAASGTFGSGQHLHSERSGAQASSREAPAAASRVANMDAYVPLMPNAVPLMPNAVPLMPNASVSSRRRRRGGDNEEEGGNEDSVGARSNFMGERMAGPDAVPVFASYSSKLSEALLNAELRSAREQQAKLEEARQAAAQARGGRGGTSAVGTEDFKGRGSAGGPRPPGFLGDNAHNAVNYSAYLKRSHKNKNLRDNNNNQSSDDDI